jgi:drug/metabolite transporter (DMT)-like permease
LSLDVMTAVFIGALLHASWNALVRGASDKFLDTVLIVVGAGVIAILSLPFLRIPDAASWPYLATSVLVHVGYFSFVALTYRKGELSFAYPIMRGSAPVFSAVAAALLLNEWPSPGGWMGILLICGGVILLAGDSWCSGSFPRASAAFAFTNAGVIVLYTLIDGVGARLSGSPFSYTGCMFVLTGIPLVAACLAGLRPKTATYIRVNWQKGLVGGAFTLGSYGLALWAMTRAPIALVAALRETSVVFAVLIAAVFLRERITRVRYSSIVMVSAGAIILKIS